MAIDPNRMVVKPTRPRAKAQISCVPISRTIPPNDRVVLGEDGFRSVISQAPRFEGELLVFNDAELYEMYVVVDMEGTLTWKAVNIVAEFRDSKTGKTFRNL